MTILMLESSRERESTLAKTRPLLRIAIDGPASAGKTVVGKMAAEKLGYRFFDTGLVYRALALAALDSGVDPGDEEELCRVAGRIEIGGRQVRSDSATACKVEIDGKELGGRLHEATVSDLASKVSSLGEVRRRLLDLQRRVIDPGGVVAAGRDVGTVVAPEADLKIFLTASPEVRAERRYGEMSKQGRRVNYHTVLSEIKQRDERDTNRELSPTVPAADAIVIQTDEISAQQVAQRIVEEASFRVAG